MLLYELKLYEMLLSHQNIVVSKLTVLETRPHFSPAPGFYKFLEPALAPAPFKKALPDFKFFLPALALYNFFTGLDSF